MPVRSSTLLLLTSALIVLPACDNDTSVNTINSPPAVSITSPVDGNEFEEGDTITFTALVDDDADKSQDLTLTWSSDIQGTLTEDSHADSQGIVTWSTVSLQPGEHLISLSAIDSRAAEGMDEVIITVNDVPDAPEITVLSPVTGEYGEEDVEFEFSALVQDEQDEPQDIAVTVESDKDDVFCTPAPNAAGIASCLKALSVGSHYLTFTADDTDGYSASSTVYFEVKAAAEIDHDLDGYTGTQGDCDDTNSAVRPGGTEYPNGMDDDCDGTVDEGTNAYDDDGDCYCEIAPCSGSTGSCGALNGSDCDDASARTWPGAGEVCDGIDNDCDSVLDEGTTCVDDDGDGFTDLAGDCVDTSPYIYPGAVELPDALDNDCDGIVDEGSTAYDDDGDCACEVGPCSGGLEPLCTSIEEGDCDDKDDAIHPAAVEMCDEVDNDCDGYLDEDDAADAPTWYADVDGDGYGDLEVFAPACYQPTGYVSNNTDCDDATASTSPSGTEVCDKVDNDCDGVEDDGVTTTYFLDADGDGFGNAYATKADCSTPTGYVTDNRDCDDTRASVNPVAIETCNGLDDDCDGSTDESDATDASTWYQDGDGDGFGAAGISSRACTRPSGYVANSADCDDTRSTVFPSATEACNSLDDDCDGTTDESDASDASTWYLDSDGDGYGTSSTSSRSCFRPAGYSAEGTDCNDALSTTFPGASETCDGADNNCDGNVDEGVLGTWYRDADGDGFGSPSTSTYACSSPSGYVSNNADCNDGDSAIHPNTRWYVDADGDGYGNASYSVVQCTQPSGYVNNSTDCNDSNKAAYPTAAESCDSVDNDCDGNVDEAGATGCTTYYYDYDGDGYGATTGTSQCLCSTSGYYRARVATDCYDYSSSAYPGQTTYFTSNRGDGSYDYDCDGSSSKQYTATYSCVSSWYCFACDTYTEGWSSSAPSCGSTGTWKTGCTASWCSCSNAGSSSRTQSCR